MDIELIFFCLYSKTMHAESLADFWRLSKWCRERMFFFYNDSLLGSFFFPTLFPLQLWPTLFLVSHGKTQAPRNVTVGLRFISWTGVTYVLQATNAAEKKRWGGLLFWQQRIYTLWRPHVQPSRMQYTWLILCRRAARQTCSQRREQKREHNLVRW